MVAGLNRMNLNLISSEHSKQVALKAEWDKIDNETNQSIGRIKCEKPVEVLFEGLDLNIYNKKSNVSFLKDIPEEFCFLHTGGWLPGNFGEDRKNTSLMVVTFLNTFKDLSGKKPALILKTYNVNSSLLDREEIIKRIHFIKNTIKSDNLPNIYLLHGEVTDEEMNLLNNDPKIKSFISFTKGEGFGRPLLEGAITGKPVICSNWSGHVDFIKPDYNILIGGELKPVHESAANNWLLKDSEWFNIDIEIAGRAMQDVFKNYKKYYKQSQKQTQYLKENFSFDKMVERLNKFLPKVQASPQHQSIKLPELKKIEENKKIEVKLPELKKINI